MVDETAVAIRALRLSLGLSLRELGGAVEVNRMTIHRYEKGTVQPSYEVLGHLAHLAAANGRADLSRVFLGPFSSALKTSVGALEKAIA